MFHYSCDTSFSFLRAFLFLFIVFVAFATADTFVRELREDVTQDRSHQLGKRNILPEVLVEMCPFHSLYPEDLYESPKTVS